MLYPIKKAVQKGQPFFYGCHSKRFFFSFSSNRESKKTKSTAPSANPLWNCQMSYIADVGHLKRIDISHLPAGVHFINFWNDTEKFI
jgi:hypothetical protein